ncbi:glycosyltransferase family 4 protein [Lachnoclostridium sp. An181]|uniref:glycosyltransferase family 4 protein n=1 Tax=Lachnoclostridium sp. An181 TaxID=1965575 RepID=UPI000B36D2F3|nr:glycosyltransferase family 4 protein [Lachnoclostridium sp. An181]OUP50103.1 hypothetical protein B5F18_04685 [Lachnoclostridium sp. An181]
MKKYKICAITTISKTMEWFVTASMKHLWENGFDISLICDMDQRFIDDNSYYASCYSIKMERGLDVLGAIKAIFQFYKIFKKNKFDIIQYTSPNASLYAAIAGKMAGVKVRLYNQCGLRYVSFEGKKRTLFKYLEKITCSLSTDVRSQSPKNMQFAIDERLCSPKKISVIGIGGTIGIDLREYDIEKKDIYKKEIRDRWKILEDSFVFGFVGRVNRDKGINELLTAFRSIVKEYANVKLLLVGMEDESNPVDGELLAWAKNNSHVIFAGNVPSKEVAQYMAAFDVLVHPTYREGFGKVLQEAMGMGTPIITTDVPGPSEVVEEGISGSLVPVKNIDLLEKEMVFLMKNESIREKYSENGRNRAIQYFDRKIMLHNIWLDYKTNILPKC